MLADLAADAEMPDVELATRFCIAKLSKVGPDEWIQLSKRAEAAGFENDAVDALFRAADTAALTGDTRRAVEIVTWSWPSSTEAPPCAAHPRVDVGPAAAH